MNHIFFQHVSHLTQCTRHYSYRTEQTYFYWIKQYIYFHDKRHPAEMGATEVSAFLTHLAVGCHVAASTQNQALAALLFLYRNVLKQDLPWLENVERAKRPARVPLVLTSKQGLLFVRDGSPSVGVISPDRYAQEDKHAQAMTDKNVCPTRSGRLECLKTELSAV